MLKKYQSTKYRNIGEGQILSKQIPRIKSDRGNCIIDNEFCGWARADIGI